MKTHQQTRKPDESYVALMQMFLPRRSKEEIARRAREIQRQRINNVGQQFPTTTKGSV